MPRVPLLRGFGWQIPTFWSKTVLGLGVLLALLLTITTFVYPEGQTIPLAGVRY